MSDYRLDRPRINGKPSAVWYVVWSEGGRSRRRTTGTTDRATAERFLAEYAAAINAPPERFDVSDILDLYLKEAPGEAEHAKAVRKHLGRLSLSSLNRQQVREFHQKRRKENASDSTINRQSRLLRAAIQNAYKEGWITLDQIPHIDAPRPAPARNRYLTEDEFQALYAAAVSPHMRTFIALAMWTGQRAGAILELKWSDIRDGIVWFRQTTHTKRRPIAVPINTPLALSLGTAMLDARTPYVIEYKRQPVRSIKKAFGRTVERAGLEDVRVHDLRRTAASRMLAGGASFAQVAAVLGDDERTVRKHYAVFASHFLGDAVNRNLG